MMRQREWESARQVAARASLAEEGSARPSPLSGGPKPRALAANAERSAARSALPVTVRAVAPAAEHIERVVVPSV